MTNSVSSIYHCYSYKFFICAIFVYVFVAFAIVVVDACTGMKCELLKRHQEAKRESDDEWSLLNMAAQISVLGAGAADGFSKDTTSVYFNSETQWRVLL